MVEEIKRESFEETEGISVYNGVAEDNGFLVCQVSSTAGETVVKGRVSGRSRDEEGVLKLNLFASVESRPISEQPGGVEHVEGNSFTLPLQKGDKFQIEYWQTSGQVGFTSHLIYFS